MAKIEDTIDRPPRPRRPRSYSTETRHVETEAERGPKAPRAF